METFYLRYNFVRDNMNNGVYRWGQKMNEENEKNEYDALKEIASEPKAKKNA